VPARIARIFFPFFSELCSLEAHDRNAKKKLCSVMEAVLSYFHLDVPIWIRSAWTITLRVEPPTQTADETLRRGCTVAVCYQEKFEPECQKRCLV
jgi:hypothetical protein